MLFKDLKVGDTIYVANPIHWARPIKKTIGKIVPFDTDGTGLEFYAENDVFLGAAKPNLSQGGIGSIFADFEAFKEYKINYHKNIIKNLNDEMDRLKEQIRLANNDLENANEMQDED